MFLDDAVLGQNLNERIVWRQCNLVSMTNKFHQNTFALIRQPHEIINAIPIKRSPPLPCAPPVGNPSNNGQGWNTVKKPSYDFMQHIVKMETKFIVPSIFRPVTLPVRNRRADHACRNEVRCPRFSIFHLVLPARHRIRRSATCQIFGGECQPT